MDCEDCDGTGKCPDCVPLGEPNDNQCETCGGTGECSTCGGTGEQK